MTDLTPTGALGALSSQSARIGAIFLRENSDLALASLALGRGTDGGDIGASLGFDAGLPGPMGWVAGRDLAACWTGPGQWMIEGPGRAGADVDFAAQVAARAPGCAVTEQTDGFVTYEIEAVATNLTALLERLVNVDPARLGPGSATRAGFHHMAILVIRRAPDRLAVLGMRSAAASIWHGLSEAAQQVEID